MISNFDQNIWDESERNTYDLQTGKPPVTEHTLSLEKQHLNINSPIPSEIFGRDILTLVILFLPFMCGGSKQKVVPTCLNWRRTLLQTLQTLFTICTLSATIMGINGGPSLNMISSIHFSLMHPGSLEDGGSLSLN